jgi:isopenicillin N synthase-like dioxygenase
MPDIPLIDIDRWRHAGTAERAATERRVDEALQETGFLLLEHHDVPSALTASLRAEARAFFSWSPEDKEPYATGVGGRGWIPPGLEANGYAEGLETPPDLKESWSSGFEHTTGDPAADAEWFAPNVWPEGLCGLQAASDAYASAMRALATELLTMLARSLGLTDDWFTSQTRASSHSLILNHYPSLRATGTPLAGQYRIGPHTDFGTITILDRQPGYGGLQVYVAGEWTDAPWVDGTLTVNIGDLMARWTADRWRSTRHRVLPPDGRGPDEDLVSLIFFYEADHDAVITPLPPPVGSTGAYPPIRCDEYLRERYRTITVGDAATSVRPDHPGL